MKTLLRTLGVLCIAFAHPARPDDAPSAFVVHGQSTVVWQSKAALRAPYSGRNSLSPAAERSDSFTATAFLGWKPGADTEIWFDPEVAQGVPLSGLTGLGGFTNGEMARVTSATPTLYRARLFARHSWNIGGGRETLEGEPHQFAGEVDRRRLVLTAGNLSVLDLFDDNAWSHDPRTQFLNWSLMAHGAFDYAADARGYSWGAALEYVREDWTLRAGRFLQPQRPNQMALDWKPLRHHGDEAELEVPWTLGRRAGAVRVLAFRNVARMSRFADALDAAARTGGTPGLDAVRTGDRNKRGAGINIEQALSAHVGAFARANASDGRTETYAFTEIDRSLSGGLALQGAAWGRDGDGAGLAFARNGLSHPHRDYLAAGGLGFFIGDGRLHYRPESIVEAYYSLGVSKHGWLTFDLQHVANPAYNHDRGPADVLSLRAHAAF